MVQHIIQGCYVGQGRGRWRCEDELSVVAHHLLFRRALLLSESSQSMTKLNECFFGSALQLFGQAKQFGYADALNDADIDLPGQHVGAAILQKLLELMHEDDKVKGIESCLDQVVRLIPGQVVPSFQYVERRLDLGNALGGRGVLRPRKLGQNVELIVQPHLLGLVAHDLTRTGSGYRTRRDEGNQRHFHVEIIPDRCGDLTRVRNGFRILHFGHDGQCGLGVFVNLERSDATGPNQTGSFLHYILDILRVIVLSAEDDHVFYAAANEKFAFVEEPHVAGPEVAIVIGAVVYQPCAELLQCQFRIVPVTQALAASSDPNLADQALFEDEVLFWLHHLDVETRDRSSATDNLRCSGDFGNLSRHPGFAQRQGTLVDGDDISAPK